MPKSEPVEMTAFYKGTVYECDYGRCKDDEGNPIWPGYTARGRLMIFASLSN